MTDDLIAFLRARLAEDEAATVAPETWTAFEENESTGTRRVDVDHSFECVTACTRAWRGVHIARHDPARVLAEVEAARVLITQYEGQVDAVPDSYAGIFALEAAIRAKATVYADHPDYDESWRP